MGNIAAIVKITDDWQRAKELTSRVVKRGNEEDRPFGDILQEEIDKLNKEESMKEGNV